MTTTILGRLITIVAFTAVIAAVAVACGGGDSEPALDAGDAPAAQATSAPAPTATTPAEPDESGLVVKDVNLQTGDFGGKLAIVIFNSGDGECYGPTVVVDLLREDKSVVGSMGIIGEPLDPGAEGEVTDRYIGAKVVEAVVSALSCDHTSVSDTGSPQRATTPFPTKAKDK